VPSLNEEALTTEFNRDGRDENMPPPFEELMQESEVATDALCGDSCIPDLKDNWDEFSLPDAHALLHVTSRRKIHHGRAGSLPVCILFFHDIILD